MSDPRTDAVQMLVGRRSRRAAIRAGAIGVAGVLGASLGARVTAQNATPNAGEVAVLFVQADFAGGTLEPNPDEAGVFTLSLTGAPRQTVYFADRPSRLVGVVSTTRFLDLLDFSPDNPPNAALVAQIGDTAEAIAIVVVELTDPRYDPTAETLTYAARLLEGFARLDLTGTGFADEPIAAAELPASFGPASLFVDSSSCTPWDPRC